MQKTWSWVLLHVKFAGFRRLFTAVRSCKYEENERDVFILCGLPACIRPRTQHLSINVKLTILMSALIDAFRAIEIGTNPFFGPTNNSRTSRLLMAGSYVSD